MPRAATESARCAFVHRFLNTGALVDPEDAVSNTLESVLPRTARS
jgi:hypothetical protein